MQVLQFKAFHLDALHQFLLVGIQSVEGIHRVVPGLVRGGIVQHEQRHKAFQSGMGGYSIYASSVDKSDPLVRLERYMRDEQGGSDGWKIERCYIREVTPLVNMIVADNFLVCYAPSDKNTYEDIPQELVDKYFKEFEKPDKFYRKTNGEIAVIRENRRQKKDMER